MKKILFILLLILSTEFFYSQSSTARFLYWSPSAEATAMGGAGVALINNTFSAYYNPASFAYNTKTSVSSSFMQPYSSFENTAFFTLNFSYPLKSDGNIALSINNFYMDSQIRTDAGDYNLGLASESPSLLKPTNFMLKLSYSRKVKNNISIGLSAAYLNIGLMDKPVGMGKGSGNSTAILFDFGFLVTDIMKEWTFIKNSSISNSSNVNVATGISAGLSFLNIGPKISFIDNVQSDPPPSIVLLGLSYMPVYSENITPKVLIDFEKRIFDSNKLDFIHMGSELLLYKLISLRFGYLINNNNSEQSFPTVGFGLNYKFISANISRYKKYILPTWQFDTRISLEL